MYSNMQDTHLMHGDRDAGGQPEEDGMGPGDCVAWQPQGHAPSLRAAVCQGPWDWYIHLPVISRDLHGGTSDRHEHPIFWQMGQLER